MASNNIAPSHTPLTWPVQEPLAMRINVHALKMNFSLRSSPSPSSSLSLTAPIAASSIRWTGPKVVGLVIAKIFAGAH